MQVMVVYDTQYGNTERIAWAIGEAVGGMVLKVAKATLTDLKMCGILIIGSPMHGGWFTEGIRDLLQTSPALEGVNVAVFDTRTRRSLFGFASPRISRSIIKNGGKLLAPPEGFIVQGIKGPLREGELERAAAWAKLLLQGCQERTTG